MEEACPLCGKKLNDTYHDTMEAWGSRITCEYELRCECGYSYEFSYGATRELFNGKEIKTE